MPPSLFCRGFRVKKIFFYFTLLTGGVCFVFGDGELELLLLRLIRSSPDEHGDAGTARFSDDSLRMDKEKLQIKI
jgi:hypothetical protein